LECNLDIRPIARACNISTSVATTYVEKFKDLGATHREICEIDEDISYTIITENVLTKIYDFV